MVDQQTVSRKWWPRCICVIIVILIIVIFWCRCPQLPCPLCPDTEEEKTIAQILIEDTRAATWMALTNDFFPSSPLPVTDVCADSSRADACAGGTYVTSTTNGVMFQFGKMLDANGEWSMTTLKKIELYQAPNSGAYDPEDETTLVLVDTLTLKMFDWLDVKPTANCVIDPYHAYTLFINDYVKLECDPDDWADLDSCKRNRSLHSSLMADVGLMTYWANSNGYTVDAEQDSTRTYASYTFNFVDPLYVDHWLGGCLEKQYADIVKIAVRYDGIPGSAGSIMDDPPTDGGYQSFPIIGP